MRGCGPAAARWRKCWSMSGPGTSAAFALEQARLIGYTRRGGCGTSGGRAGRQRRRAAKPRRWRGRHEGAAFPSMREGVARFATRRI